MLSALITKGKENKGGGRKLLEVMDKLVPLRVMMVSWV